MLVELREELKSLRFMRYRMNSSMALFSHILRFIIPFVRPYKGVKEERSVIEGLRCSVFTSGNQRKGTLLSLHGGAFASPAAPYHKKNASYYATAGYRVIMPDYPLLPFHHHPEILEKIIMLAENISDLSVIEGDSAGGFLAIHTASALRIRPDLMLIYPVVMPDDKTESMRMYSSTPMWDSRSNDWMIRHYLHGNPKPSHDVSGVRSAYVETAEYDPLHDEGIMIADELRRAGAAVTLAETSGTVHGYDFLWSKPYVQAMLARRKEWLAER